MRLGSVELGRLFLAPLSGVADSPFRRICKRFGAETVYSEMVSAEGLIRSNRRSRDLLRFTRDERPIGIQIFGRDPARMAAAAEVAQELGPDLIDINLACPARRIVSRGEGSALLRDPPLVGRIARAVVDAVSLPVTAKIRIGWDEQAINCAEIADILEDSGVVAVAVHGRTWRQGFRGRSSWKRVAGIKRVVRIPVILSGDVTGPEAAEAAFSETGCDAVMLGRGIFGRPWLFRSVGAHLSGTPCGAPSGGEMAKTIVDHLDMAIDHLGEKTATVRFRKHLLWYTKGLRGVVALRPAMSHVATRQEVVRLVEGIFPDGGSVGGQAIRTSYP
jgi:nifR3 family TIM-barrel protein